MRTRWAAWIAAAGLVGCGDTKNITIKVEAPEVDGFHQPDPDPEDGDPADPDDGGSDDEPDASPKEDAGAPPEDAGTEPDAAGPVVIGGLTVDTPYVEQVIDLFAKPGHRFWMQVSDEQRELMNQRWGGGPIFIEQELAPLPLPYEPMAVVGAPVPPPPLDGGFVIGDGGAWEEGDGGIVIGSDGGYAEADGGVAEYDAGSAPGDWQPLPEDDPYQPGGGGDSDATYVDHMVVQELESGSIADYGKVKLRLVGESTFRAWTPESIPNLRIDMDGFTENMRLGGFEHIRLNNGQVGTIFREALTHRIYRAMDYPGLRSSWAMLGSNVWGEGAWIPMVLMEVYKKKFCEDNQELVGGTCVNMWEFYGDAAEGGGWGGGRPANACQVSECDDSKLDELAYAVATAPDGDGFMDALSNIIDWPRFHQFQCLSWIMWTGDDPLHNANNNLIMERDDGRLVWGPYSVDISAGQYWYQNTPLYGDTSAVARGCQRDAACWQGVLSTCEQLIEKFDALNPELMVDDTVAQLDALGMLRRGDDDRAQNLRDWFVWRQENLRSELDRYRYPPGLPCPDDLERCNDQSCGTPEQCLERRCEPGLEWCDSLQYCVYPGDPCPVCDEENPYVCQAMWPPVCVADESQCVGNGGCDFGYYYCEWFGQCIPEMLPCGGFPIPGIPEPAR